MSSKQYKRGKVPLKQFGKRVLFLADVGWVPVEALNDVSLRMYASQESAFAHQSIAELLGVSSRHQVITGLVRDAYELIASAYRYSRERSLVGRALTEAVDRARISFAKLHGVDPDRLIELLDENRAFEEAERHWRLATAKVIEDWPDASHRFNLV
ncbi:MAG: hypothetical protein WBP22_01565 [Candidatus Saccharimonas sp.]